MESYCDYGSFVPALTHTGIRFPFVIKENLLQEDVDRWLRFYKNPLVASWDNTVEEGLWRRTQDRRNAAESGWCGEGDMRRRMVHYQYKFSLVYKGNIPCLALASMYLWWHVCLPIEEINVYEEQIYAGLQIGGWKQVVCLGSDRLFHLGDVYIRMKNLMAPGEYDREAQRIFPTNYRILEVSAFSIGESRTREFLDKPWVVLSTGIREKDVRGHPRVNDWDSLKNLFPAQVEVGCGPSVEAGIPALHFLHGVYCVTNKETGRFIFSPYEDCLIRRLAECSEETLRNFSEMYLKCFTSQPTTFHYLLKSLYDRGYIVGPIITNNFDGLMRRVGLPELFVRRYEDVHIVPNMEFHPLARSLLVVGSHADRRRIQAAARKKGLPVVYIDPEGFNGIGGSGFSSYLLESPQDGDYLFKLSATDWITKVASRLA